METPENIDAVRDLILGSDRRIRIKHDLRYLRFHMNVYVQQQKISVKWIHKYLNADQRRPRVETPPTIVMTNMLIS